MRIRPGPNCALIVVQPQNDFFEGGSVPVVKAEKLVPRLNRYVAVFERSGATIVVARDWHPWDHCSFFANGGHWMRHCVRGEFGAEFHRGVRVPRSALVVSLGTEADRERTSVFDGTLLNSQLKPHVRRLYFAGLQVGNVLGQSALDARFLGYEVTILEDATRSWKLSPLRRSMLLRAGVHFAKGLVRDAVRSRD